MKVYGIDAHLSGVRGQQRAIVAARSKVAAAKAMDLTVYFFNGYGDETGNAEEIATAMAKPGTVFTRPLDDFNAEWEELR